jgi:methyltransferase (TIGR00027 family)
MLEGKPSFMAEAVALFRAAHQIIDDDPKILDDPFAIPILGPETADTIDEKLQSLRQPYLKKARALIVARSRYTEDELIAATRRGVSQYVILGAGLDTSAYRLPPEVGRLALFEVDHPDTQQWKLDRLRAAGIKAPDNLRYVGADLNQQSLPDALAAHEFDTAKPAFFSWLGVCCYLELPAVYALLDFVGTLPPASQIVFDFLLDGSALAPQNRREVAAASNVGQRVGEPWITAFIPDDLERDLRRAGFSKTCYMSPERINARYFNDRQDGLILDPAMQIMSAIV